MSYRLERERARSSDFEQRSYTLSERVTDETGKAATEVEKAPLLQARVKELEEEVQSLRAAIENFRSPSHVGELFALEWASPPVRDNSVLRKLLYRQENSSVHSRE